eukprot:6668653-Ditylum_brightwellii.AAC.1
MKGCWGFDYSTSSSSNLGNNAKGGNTGGGDNGRDGANGDSGEGDNAPLSWVEGGLSKLLFVEYNQCVHGGNFLQNPQIVHYCIQSLINVKSLTTDPWGEEDHNLADPTAPSSAPKSAIQHVNTALNPDMVAAASATFCCGEGIVPVVQSHLKMMTQHEEEGAIVPPFL